MHLYQGSTERFIGDAVRNRLATQLAQLSRLERPRVALPMVAEDRGGYEPG